MGREYKKPHQWVRVGEPTGDEVKDHIQSLFMGQESGSLKYILIPINVVDRLERKLLRDGK